MVICDDTRTSFYLNASDLQAAQLLQGHAWVLPQQTDPILQPADGGDGVARGLALQQRDAIHPERLIGRALANDGRGPVCEHCKSQRWVKNYGSKREEGKYLTILTLTCVGSVFIC